MERNSHRFAIAAAGLALLGFAAPASATDYDSPPPTLAISAAPVVSSAKSEALLGRPSALEAVTQGQRLGTFAHANAGAIPIPSSYPDRSRRAMFAPKLRTAHATRPDVFGSVALGVTRTPFDARWAGVFADNRLGSARRVATDLADADRMEAIKTINAYVNARVAFTEDRDQYRVADRWSRAADTLARGAGDCEDYAIAKMQMLRAAGFAEEDLYLVVLKDLVRRADHAVLVVRHEGRFLVLDNGTDKILDSDAVRDYRPILTYSAGQSWTHGYSRPQAPAFSTPIRVASL
ncbi:transglutaminase-like cysteine peptidase [Sphingomicrobium sediminis]|uniref:Transglutaminase-like cysteine peptidase n=1 Tax=Sphingomicrobium sediminis TaxID=2950949 RepID=A0A9X2J5M4_9SPHN|nr:transglutaminase-like cysteine peptidase [Sphingomicrobium sediminis]MCM8558387.1 transglutaminase-like cysteine peptidase [Sphingomicrobium sediminis]